MKPLAQLDLRYNAEGDGFRFVIHQIGRNDLFTDHQLYENSNIYIYI